VAVPRPFENSDVDPRTRVRAVAQLQPGGAAAEVDFQVYEVPVNPPSVPLAEAALEDDDLVLGLVLNGQAVAYPVRYLMLCGVINDNVGGLPLAATWSSLSGSGAIFARSFGGSANVFDFGAALVKSNLLVVDRRTQSVWSQLSQRAIAGPMKGTKLEIVPSLQTTWKYWQRMRPDTRVVILEGEEGRPYLYQAFDPAEGYSVGGDAAHDTANLGLGIVYRGKAHFLPLTELARRVVPAILGEGARRVSIIHKPEALTAWAENAQGMTVGSVLCYRDAWLAFHPGSEVFAARE
jgi:hypothetical protein